MSMRIFVTGASGVIGSRVVPALLAAGHQVTAVTRSEAAGEALASRGATVRNVNLFAPTEVRAAVAGHDVVINLATHMPPMTVRMFLPGAWRENDRLRRSASANLVDAALAAGATRFIQESFAPIYSDGGDGWIDESVPLRPVHYNRTILDAEASAHRFAYSGSGAAVVLRFAAFYGPDAGQLGVMVALVRRGWMPLLGPADSYMSSVSHDDAAAAVVAALDVPTDVYNVSDDEPLRHRAFADALADALGVPRPHLPPAWTAYLAGGMGNLLARSQRVSNARLRAASGWAPRYRSVREGFPAAVGAFPPAPRRRRGEAAVRA
jgi:nucleoside-diphosphate-sugar epimerase